MPFDGLITLSGRLRTVPFTAEFAVSDISQDVILGMAFFQQFECGFSFNEAEFTLKGKKLKCLDSLGSRLVADVQVLRAVEVPADAEMMVRCRVSMDCSQQTGMVERLSDSGVLVAPSIYTLDSDRHLMVRCLNLSTSPVTLTAGSRLAKFLTLVLGQISQPLTGEPQSVAAVSCVETEMGPVPAHLTDLYDRAIAACPELDSSRRPIHRILCDYADVFSKDSSDVGRTHLMQH